MLYECLMKQEYSRTSGTARGLPAIYLFPAIKVLLARAAETLDLPLAAPATNRQLVVSRFPPKIATRVQPSRKNDILSPPVVTRLSCQFRARTHFSRTNSQIKRAANASLGAAIDFFTNICAGSTRRFPLWMLFLLFWDEPGGFVAPGFHYKGLVKFETLAKRPAKFQRSSRRECTGTFFLYRSPRKFEYQRWNVGTEWQSSIIPLDDPSKGLKARKSE